jgi:hypothetical protein
MGTGVTLRVMTQPSPIVPRLKELTPSRSSAAMRPRPPVIHQHGGAALPKRGIRVTIQHNKDVKAWSDARKAAQAAIEARAATGIMDVDADREEEETLMIPKPEKPNLVQSCVKMKLASFCGHDGIRRVINNVVMDTNVMCAEGAAFANFHVTRVLERGGPPPKLDQSFYYACLAAVTVCGSKHADDFKASIKAFDALRPEGATKVDSVKLGDVQEELANSMAAAASLHLWSNFPKRLSAYLKFKHPEIKRTLRKVVVNCVAVFPSAALTKVARLSLKTSKDKPLSEEAKRHIRNALEIIRALRARCPVKTANVEARSHVLLPLHHDMMTYFESAYAASQTEDPVDFKRAQQLRKCRFSLLPNKHGFTVASVPICGRAMANILTRVRDVNGVALSKFKGADSEHDSKWRKHFNVNRVETKERRFAGRISTDGYAVSVHMLHENACVLSKVNDEWEPSRIRRENKGKLPVTYAGVDPGYTDVVTVAHTRELQGIREGEDKSISATVKSYSASRYAEASKQKTSNRRTAEWNKETNLDCIVTESDRSTAAGYGTFVRSYLACYRDVLSHRAKRGYRNMRFLRYVFKQRAVAEVCDFIAPAGHYTVVGYGDWTASSGSPIKRRWSGPQEDIRRALRLRSDVLFWNVREHKTSVTCHATWRRLTNMRAKSHRYDRASKAMIQGERSSVHKVLHCRRSAGVKGRPGGGTWNRDANASRNMLMLMMLVVLGVERPKEFTPAVTTERRQWQGSKSASSSPALPLSSVPPQ